LKLPRFTAAGLFTFLIGELPVKSIIYRFAAFAVPFCIVASGFAVQAQGQVDLTTVFSAQVEEDEIDAFNGDVDQAFFNVQGDDDAFTVYSLADFDTAGIGQVASIDSIDLDLAQSNAGFSATGGLEFFLATDTRVVDLNDTARYQSDQANGGNNGADVVGSAFGTLHALGTGTYTVGNNGDVDSFAFSLDAAGEAFAISQINSGGLLRVIATPGDLGVQATYSGATSLLDPPAPPVLRLGVTAIPEPGSMTCLLAIGLAALTRRKRG
jgi:hypothetical protein